MAPTLQAALPKMLPVRIPAALEGVLARALGLEQLDSIYSQLRATNDSPHIATRLLQYLEVTERISEIDLARIPKSGAMVVVANHPFGVLEGAVLADLFLRIRADVKFLANGILLAIPESRDLLIPVDPMGGKSAAKANKNGVRAAIDLLVDGGLLVVFPAGEVAHFAWKRRVSDPAWNPAVVRMLAAAKRRSATVSVLPIYVEGKNSLLFQAAGLIHGRLRTALLARELLNKRGVSVSVRIGSSIPAGRLESISTDAERIEYLRWRTYLLASRNDYKPRTNTPLAIKDRTGQAAAIAPPGDPEAMAREIAELQPLISSSDLSVYAAHSHQIPSVLQEIGRLREIAFRAAGEGTGRPRDLDAFDQQYLHLFLWNASKREVAGAYRLAGTDSVESLYTATLFEYGEEFRRRLGHALELGRSFVRVEYQRALAPLLLLWKGIARYVARNPRYKILFGAVSISNRYQATSRSLMVSFLESTAWLRDWAGMVSSRNPFRFERPARQAFDLDDLSALVSDIDPSQGGVPVLLRQYLKLGGKLLGFNVDPKFANALDGLILVDLTQTESKLLERFLGAREAAQFLAHHKGQYVTQ